MLGLDIRFLQFQSERLSLRMVNLLLLKAFSLSVKRLRPALARLDRELCCFCDTSEIEAIELSPCKPGLGQGCAARIGIRQTVTGK